MVLIVVMRETLVKGYYVMEIKKGCKSRVSRETFIQYIDQNLDRNSRRKVMKSTWHVKMITHITCFLHGFPFQFLRFHILFRWWSYSDGSARAPSLFFSLNLMIPWQKKSNWSTETTNENGCQVWITLFLLFLHCDIEGMLPTFMHLDCEEASKWFLIERLIIMNGTYAWRLTLFEEIKRNM